MTAKSAAGASKKAVPDRSWRPRQGLDRTQRAREQDRAAGGADHRLVDTGGGRLQRATVVLNGSSRTGRIKAVLQWSVDGRKSRVPLGDVDRPTRGENLRAGWRLADEAGLLSTEPVPESSWASSPATRKSMRANTGKNTKPELRLRSLLHREGFRFRVSARPVQSLRRTADVVFRTEKVAVFVDGCYWHGCTEHRGVLPKTNQSFWAKKIEGNKARDRETVRLLEQSGWKVLRFWEHTSPEEAARTVIEAVTAARAEAAAAK
ncbi:very short patch repair endonuclease [Streptomyces sp. Y1]|uniref:Very short patch repair endonuclease n=1 Tax=Streptomyces sp. Y1 TaxID=3238634 RepID=A0AB39TRT4_9ACTN